MCNHRLTNVITVDDKKCFHFVTVILNYYRMCFTFKVQLQFHIFGMEQVHRTETRRLRDAAKYFENTSGIRLLPLTYSVVDGPVMVTSARAEARVWPDERKTGVGLRRICSA